MDIMERVARRHKLSVLVTRKKTLSGHQMAAGKHNNWSMAPPTTGCQPAGAGKNGRRTNFPCSSPFFVKFH